MERKIFLEFSPYVHNKVLHKNFDTLVVLGIFGRDSTFLFIPRKKRLIIILYAIRLQLFQGNVNIPEINDELGHLQL